MSHVNTIASHYTQLTMCYYDQGCSIETQFKKKDAHCYKPFGNMATGRHTTKRCKKENAQGPDAIVKVKSNCRMRTWNDAGNFLACSAGFSLSGAVTTYVSALLSIALVKREKTLARSTSHTSGRDQRTKSLQSRDKHDASTSGLWTISN